CSALEQKLSAEFISLDIKEALDNLGLIVGQTTTEDLLEHIFSNFCIGK
ncbi:MAG: tRNA uridine-5-carboxymethylaminomethyl(34) synthesis GTPase MnmE, partial [Candidatus Omnitrophica bacterium]|nr:tRNA uridine-5-carboxymethylaminomethyl(34) synthesis GTPase MnmE [Candidatus Omnitrophota bacterium]